MGYDSGSKNQYDADGDLLVDVSDSSLTAGTPTEYNIDIPSADTEYSQALPANTLAIEFRCRDYEPLRWSFTTGKVATPTAPYNQLKSGASYWKDGLDLSSKTLYFACANGGQVVELTVWT